MKLFGARSSPPKVGLFGKLPSYGDFMSMHAESPEGQTLAKWLQEGVGQAGVQIGGDQFVHFLWEPSGARARTVVGILWPSADSAGRRFPFCLFASVPGAALTPLDTLKVIAVEPLWRQMHDLYAQLHSLGDLNAQYGLLQEAQPLDVLDEAAASQAYDERARSSSLQGAKRIAVALHLRDLVEFGKGVAGAGADLPFALRMKLHGRLDPDLEAATWLRVIRSLIGRQPLGRSLFIQMNRGEGTQSATLFRRKLQSSDLPGLFGPPTQSRTADTIGYRTAATSDEDARFREAFDRRWASRPSVYATLLDVGLMSWDAEAMAAPPPQPMDAGPPTVAEADDDVITGEILETMPDVSADALAAMELAADATQSPTMPAAAEVQEDDADAITGEIVMEPVAAPAAETMAPDGDPSADVTGPSDAAAPADAAAPEASPPDPEPQETAPPADTATSGAGPETAAPETAAPEMPTAADMDVPAEVDAAREEAPHGAEMETGETVETVEPPAAVARLLELVQGPMRSGRLLNVGTADGGVPLLVYIAEGESQGEPAPTDPEAVEEIRREIANYREAQALLLELGSTRPGGAEAAGRGAAPPPAADDAVDADEESA